MPSLKGNDWIDWFRYAKEDKEEAIDRFSHRKWREACYHSQQAIEKLLKALAIKVGIFAPTYDIVGLLKLIEEKYEVEILGVTINEEPLRELTIHYYASRYPDASRRFKIKYDECTAKRCIEMMKKIWKEVEKLCQNLE